MIIKISKTFAKFLTGAAITAISLTFPTSAQATENVNVTNSTLTVINQSHYSKTEINNLNTLKNINDNIVKLGFKILKNNQFENLLRNNKLFLKNPNKSKHVDLKKTIIDIILDSKTTELLLNKYLEETNITSNQSKYSNEMNTYRKNIEHYLNTNTKDLGNFDKVIMNFLKLKELELKIILNSNSELIKNIYQQTYSNTKIVKFHKESLLKITSDDYKRLLHQYTTLINFIYEWGGNGFKLNSNIKKVYDNLKKYTKTYYSLKKLEEDLKNKPNINDIKDLKDQLNNLVQ